MSYIAAIGTAVPKYGHSQHAISEYFQQTIHDIDVRRKIRIVFKKSGIEKRYSVLPDFEPQHEEKLLFKSSQASGAVPDLSARMAIYKQHAIHLSLDAVRKIEGFEDIKHSITHVITVTCTGLFAPGLDIELIKELNLSLTTQRSSINFMGCNAAILAMNSAHAICSSIPKSRVLVVCTEICTIHFQKKYSSDNILSTALFADGSAAVLIDSEPPPKPYFQNLSIQRFHSLLIHEGKDEMAWNVSEAGFIMNLTSYISELIHQHIERILEKVLAENAINYWAIHPGGKKILDDFCRVLHLPHETLKESYDVLKNYGNMSSVTILFVLKNIIHNRSQEAGKTIFTAAFGPGISIETMVLKYV